MRRIVSDDLKEEQKEKLLVHAATVLKDNTFISGLEDVSKSTSKVRKKGRATLQKEHQKDKKDIGEREEPSH